MPAFSRHFVGARSEKRCYCDITFFVR